MIGRVEEFAAKGTESLETIDWLGKREVIRTLVKRVEIYPDRVKVVFRVGTGPLAPRMMTNVGNWSHCCERIGFVRQPLPVDFSPPLASQMFVKDGSKSFLPVPHHFVGKLESTKQEEFDQAPKAELESHSTKQYLKENVGGYFNEIERGASPFAEGAIAVAAMKNGIPEVGGALEAIGVVRLAIGAGHSMLDADRWIGVAQLNRPIAPCRDPRSHTFHSCESVA